MSNLKIDYLIGVLHDKSLELGVRDDAAMDLGSYDEHRVLEALIQTAGDTEEDEMILDACGESIREIWIRKGKYSPALFAEMSSVAQSACDVSGLQKDS